jgi:hypothetical protein
MGEQGEARKSNQQQTRAHAGKGATRRSADEPTSWGFGNSVAYGYRPATPTNTVFSSSPMIPAILLMVVFLTLLSSSTTRGWLISAGQIPNMAWASITGGTKKLPAPEASTTVWVKRQSGLYYCRGDVLFGRHPGSLMRQDKALTLGYRPASDAYCQDASRKAPARQESPVAQFLGIH